MLEYPKLNRASGKEKVSTANNHFFNTFKELSNEIVNECVEQTIKETGYYPSIEAITKVRESLNIKPCIHESRNKEAFNSIGKFLEGYKDDLMFLDKAIYIDLLNELQEILKGSK